MTMQIQRLISQAPAWTDESWAARIDQSASLLFVHGYITQSQRTKITQRIEKQFADAIAAGEIVERPTILAEVARLNAEGAV